MAEAAEVAVASEAVVAEVAQPLAEVVLEVAGAELPSVAVDLEVAELPSAEAGLEAEAAFAAAKWPAEGFVAVRSQAAALGAVTVAGTTVAVAAASSPAQSQAR